MIKPILVWMLGCSTDDETQRLMDEAYVEGAHNERQAILGILDRLIPEFNSVNTSLARQVRDQILSR